jgi:cohesin complex subunit SA-1/2
LGSWIDVFPPFLKPDYLKYLGWSLNDPSHEVRKASLDSLHSIFSKHDIKGSLYLFTEKFSKRILEMTSDVDSVVTARAVDVLTLLEPYDEHIMRLIL